MLTRAQENPANCQRFNVVESYEATDEQVNECVALLFTTKTSWEKKSVLKGKRSERFSKTALSPKEVLQQLNICNCKDKVLFSYEISELYSGL